MSEKVIGLSRQKKCKKTTTTTIIIPVVKWKYLVVVEMFLPTNYPRNHKPPIPTIPLLLQ